MCFFSLTFDEVNDDSFIFHRNEDNQKFERFSWVQKKTYTNRVFLVGWLYGMMLELLLPNGYTKAP